MPDEKENVSGFPKLDWSFLDEHQDDILSSPVDHGSVVDDMVAWPSLDAKNERKLDAELEVSPKRQRAFDMSELKAPLIVLRARAITKKSDPGDELSFFHDDKTSIEDLRLFAKEDKVIVLFDGADPSGKGFLFAFAVPERAKRLDFY